MGRILEIKKRMEELFKEMRAISDKAAAESRSLDENENTAYEKLRKEMNSLKEERSRLEELAAFEAGLDGANNRGNNPPGNDPAARGNTSTDDWGFRSLGEFVSAVINEPQNLRSMESSIGESGGFMIPPKFRENILSINPEEAIMRPRALVLPVDETHPDATISVPYFKQGEDGVYGGVTFGAVKDYQTGKKNSAGLGMLKLTPAEQSGYVELPNRLLRNAPAASVFVETLFRNAKTGYEEQKFFKGKGGDEALGSFESKCAIDVARSEAGKILFADVLDMYSKLLDLENGYWIADRTAIPQIAALKDGSGNSIFIGADATKKIPATLLGLPISFTGKTEQLGKRGDLSLINPNYYLIQDGSGPLIASSEHAQFKQNVTVVKMVWSFDGACWVKDKLKQENGAYVSPVVMLK